MTSVFDTAATLLFIGMLVALLLGLCGAW